jgi:hypothetical protein
MKKAINHPHKGHLLLSEPFLNDEFFKRSVILLAENSSSGSMGFIINKPMGYYVHELIKSFPESEMPVYFGGPVENNSLFFLPFRSTTYQEFIEVIIDGLTDPNDLPELGLSLSVNSVPDNNTVKKAKTNIITQDIFPLNWNRRVFRPGAPKWGIGSQSTSIVVAINFPAMEDLTNGITGFVQGILNILKSSDAIFFIA